MDTQRLGIGRERLKSLIFWPVSGKVYKISGFSVFHEVFLLTESGRMFRIFYIRESVDRFNAIAREWLMLFSHFVRG